MFQHYQGLGHVAIHTKNMDESIAFYEKIGGALRQRASIPTPDGDKLLALVSFGGFTLELIQSPTPMPLTEGNVPHFAVYVDDLDAAAAAVKAAALTAAPWLLSGCIHLDGFLDCCDAIFSRRDLETRQRILKDSHVGSFAVIGMVLLALGAFSLWSGCGTVRPWALSLLPVATRSAAAVAVTCMKPMGHSQYAGVFDRRDRARTLALPAVCLAVSCVLPAALWGAEGLAPLAGACGYGLAVRYAARQLGGVSGDVSGFALTLGELCGAAALALV